MKRLIIVCISMATSTLLSGCWVTTSKFDAYVEATELRLEQAKRNDDVLFCESKVDAYEDMINSDEPDPTRRDEPSGTRRDLASCEREFGDVAGANVAACSTDMERCSDGGVHTTQACRTCYVKCLNIGTWPTTGAFSCPL